jgi:hypothetical protein
MNRDELRIPQHSRSRRSTTILLDVVAARAGQTRVHAVSGPGFRHRGLPLLLRTSHHVLNRTRSTWKSFEHPACIRRHFRSRNA